MMAPVFSRESWRCAWYMIQVWHYYILVLLNIWMFVLVYFIYIGEIL